jgi:hypothetical protein
VANERTFLRAATCLAISALIGACSGVTAASPVPASAPLASTAVTPPPTPSPEPFATVEPTAAPATPRPTPKPRPSLDVDLTEIAAYLTSSITLLNLGDEDLSVLVAYLDPGSDVPFPLGVYALGSMDQVTNDAPPGTYVLEFRQPAAAAAATTCTIEMADSDGYVFAALGDAIAIRSSATPPATAGDLFVATSPLCVD